MEITDDTVVARVAGVVGADAGEMHVLLNDDLRYLGVEQVGLRIWDLVEQPHTFGELVDALVAEYDVTPDQCRREVGPFVARLAEHRLVALR